MKTRRIASMTGGLLTILVAALILLTTTACEKDPPIFDEDFTKISKSIHNKYRYDSPKQLQ